MQRKVAHTQKTAHLAERIDQLSIKRQEIIRPILEHPREYVLLSVRAMAKSGEVAKLYDKWFMQPIPPTNTKVGLPLSEATKAAWANPNNKPMEDYVKK